MGRKLKVINKFWSPVEKKDSEKKERFGKRGQRGTMYGST